MARCDQMVESGIVAYGCYLDPGHNGPHAAVEVPRSVEQRSVWERNQQEIEAVEAVATPVIVAEDFQPLDVVPPLEQLQGKPQTFWQANKDDEPQVAPSPQQEVPVADAPNDAIDFAEVAAITDGEPQSIELAHVQMEVERLIREEAARGQITPPALADTIARGVWEFLEMVYANGVTDGVFAERGRVMQRIFGDD